LITHLVSIQPPDPPACISPKCLFRFMMDSLFVALLSSYHSRRVNYCESMRYVADDVHGVYRIRRAGLVPGTNELYPYKPEVYGTIQEAQKACDRIGDKVLERYRTGKPSPKNIWQTVHANLKLRCPVCRKYNIDPLLFGGE